MSSIQITFSGSSSLSSKATIAPVRLDGGSLLGFRFPSTWPTGTTIYFLEADGLQDQGNRPLVDTAGALITMTGMDPNGTFPKGKTVKDPSFPALFYSVTNLILYATPAPPTAQVIEVIVDAL